MAKQEWNSIFALVLLVRDCIHLLLSLFCHESALCFMVLHISVPDGYGKFVNCNKMKNCWDGLED